jgi:NAD+ synthase (glutamine-hydrolysing)
MRIALYQMNATVGDLKGNSDKIFNAIEKAREVSADIIVFPELALTGYPPQDLIFEKDFVRLNLEYLNNIIRKTRSVDIVSIVGYIDNPREGEFYNAIAVVSGGELVKSIYKTHLPTYDVFDEKRYFQSNTRIEPVPISINGKTINLGIEICEDLWDNEYPVKVTRELVEKGAELIINCSASPYSYHKFLKRKELVLDKVKTFKIPFCYVNMTGGQDELIFDGNSFAVDKDGSWAAFSGGHKENMTYADFDPVFAASMSLPEPKIVLDHELLNSLIVGIRDYFTKTGFSDALIGLSGGIDSALVASIAADALGPDHVWGVLMPSQFSSDHSVTDALDLAKNLAIHCDTISIQPVYKTVTQMLDKQFKGTGFGLAEENIQARSRGVILMALANKFNRLVLTTGNKTELALGYSTLYGDMAGALAPISDLNKEDVYRLSRFINSEAGYNRIPENILNKIPSAELRENQYDPFDYEVVSPLVEELLENNKSTDQLVQEGYEKELVLKLNRMIHLAEYKRRQAPPGLRVTEKAFGMGRRIPIVNRFMYKDQKL